MHRKLLLDLILIGAVCVIPVFAAPSDGNTLFAIAESPKSRSAIERSSVASVRESEINIDLESLKKSISSRLSFPLFDGRIYTATRLESEGFESRSIDDLTWRGKIELGKSSGDVVLTAKHGYVSGLIYSPAGVYEVVPKGSKQFLVELDQSLYPECGGEIAGDKPITSDAEIGGSIPDSGDRIDVLVVYTTPVKVSLGGREQAEAFAQQAIDITNTTYINSKIRQRVHLAKAVETAIAETGSLSTELPILRSDAATATIRNNFNADLVAMISNSGGACGIGYLMGGLGGNQNNGFTVTARTCAVGNLSFPHELGHNMGSHHNPENGSNPTFPYGFGHYVNANYRTVMSYVDPCTSGCTRRPYFSNPDIIFNGVPTGIANARDNARSMDNTADWISNYRYSGSSIRLNVWNVGELINRGGTRTVTWSSNNVAGSVRIELSRDEATSWETLVADSPNDGRENIRLFGRPTRGARIRVVSVDEPTISDSSLANFSIR